METWEHIDALRQEGESLAAAAERGGPGALVPPCPEWRVRDLLRHIGCVHRWAEAYVARRLPAKMTRAEEQATFGPAPDDADLVGWFREGHVRLVSALESAKPDLECWHFLKSPSARAFWARRQAHETAIHRVDAESAAGEGISPIPAPLALDGVDELLSGFHTRPRSRVRSDRPRVLRVHAMDAESGEADWFVHLSAEAPRVERSGDAADCTVSGLAAELYLALWNRSSGAALQVRGDASLLDLWQRLSAITWS